MTEQEFSDLLNYRPTFGFAPVQRQPKTLDDLEREQAAARGMTVPDWRREEGRQYNAGVERGQQWRMDQIDSGVNPPSFLESFGIGSGPGSYSRNLYLVLAPLTLADEIRHRPRCRGAFRLRTLANYPFSNSVRQQLQETKQALPLCLDGRWWQ